MVDKTLDIRFREYLASETMVHQPGAEDIDTIMHTTPIPETSRDLVEIVKLWLRDNVEDFLGEK